MASMMGNLSEWINFTFDKRKNNNNNNNSGNSSGSDNDANNGTQPAPGPTSPTTQGDLWYYDIDKVTYSASLFYGYVTIVPLLLWLMMKYFRSPQPLISLVCIYGYSMVIFLPASWLCTVPNNAFQWTVVFLATGIGAGFIMLNFRKTINDAINQAQDWIGASAVGRSCLGRLGQKGLAWFLLFLIGAIHIGLGFAMKLYFFSYD